MSTDRFQAISEHLRLHIEEGHLEDGICEHELCHANMYSLTAEVKDCSLVVVRWLTINSNMRSMSPSIVITQRPKRSVMSYENRSEILKRHQRSVIDCSKKSSTSKTSGSNCRKTSYV